MGEHISYCFSMTVASIFFNRNKKISPNLQYYCNIFVLTLKLFLTELDKILHVKDQTCLVLHLSP